MNYESSELRDYLIGVLVHLVRDVKVDGFRCDVAGAVPIDFWEAARVALDKVNPEVIMLSEADSPSHLLKAFDISFGVDGAAATAVLNFTIDGHYPHIEDDILVGGGIMKGPRFVLRNDSRRSLKSAAGVPLA